MLKQRSQNTTSSRTATSADARARASARGHAGGGRSTAGRSWARCPGSRLNASISFATGSMSRVATRSVGQRPRRPPSPPQRLHRAHLLLGQPARRVEGLVDRGGHQVLEHLDVVGVDSGRVDRRPRRASACRSPRRARRRHRPSLRPRSRPARPGCAPSPAASASPCAAGCPCPCGSLLVRFGSVCAMPVVRCTIVVGRWPALLSRPPPGRRPPRRRCVAPRRGSTPPPRRSGGPARHRRWSRRSAPPRSDRGPPRCSPRGRPSRRSATWRRNALSSGKPRVTTLPSTRDRPAHDDQGLRRRVGADPRDDLRPAFAQHAEVARRSRRAGGCGRGWRFRSAAGGATALGATASGVAGSVGGTPSGSALAPLDLAALGFAARLGARGSGSGGVAAAGTGDGVDGRDAARRRGGSRCQFGRLRGRRRGLPWREGGQSRVGEERELELEPEPADAGPTRVDGREPSGRCREGRHGMGDRAIRARALRVAADDPGSERLDHLVEEAAEVTAAVLEPGQKADARRGRRSRRAHRRSRRWSRCRPGPSRSRTRASSSSSVDDDSSWSSIDSASRMPPAASRAMRRTASGEAVRPSASRILRSLPSISSVVRRRTSNRWRREMIAGGNSWGGSRRT